MAKAYPMELRERVMAACDRGSNPEEAAELFFVSERWVYTLRARRKETGSIAPRVGGRGRSPKLAPPDERIRELLNEQPDATLMEMCEKLPVSVSPSTMCRRLQKLKITLKKRFSKPPSKSVRM